MKGVKYFQLGAMEPFLNELGVSSEKELYHVLGFGDRDGFKRRSWLYYENDEEGGIYAEDPEGAFVLIEVTLLETWVSGSGPWKEYEKVPTWFRLVVTKRFFDEVDGNPVAAVRRAKGILKEAGILGPKTRARLWGGPVF